MKISRRDMLKGSGLALGGLALPALPGSAIGASSEAPLEEVHINIEHPPVPGTMRITFCGSWYTPRPDQACNSVFVELGNGDPSDENDWGDSFVFDCGAGVVAKYVALGVPWSRLQQIFLTHLHADHMSDLTTIYCFGPSGDRKTALHVYGPSGDTKNEGTWFFCKTLLELCKWHRESFSFLPTGYLGDGDGYDLVAHELRYMQNPGVAYEDQARGVKITHFPAIHARDGAISYRLEWNGFSLIFTGDTKPNTYVVQNGQGLDVLIHEMATPPDIWVTRETGMVPGDDGYAEALAINTEVIANSHTLQTAFGYVMSQTNPKLAVATHFPDDPDLVPNALQDIACFYGGPVIIAKDLKVITLAKDAKGQTVPQVGTATTDPYPWIHTRPFTGKLAPAKYSGPLAQFNQELIDHIIRADLYAQPGPFCRP